MGGTVGSWKYSATAVVNIRLAWPFPSLTTYTYSPPLSVFVPFSIMHSRPSPPLPRLES